MDFEKASRIRLRFDTPQGSLTVEDLWALPLTSRTGRANLDDIAKSLNRQLKETAEESFVVKNNKTNEGLQLAFDLVKHVIEVRVAENEAADQAAAKKEQKQKLLALIVEKKDEDLKGKTVEELEAMVGAL